MLFGTFYFVQGVCEPTEGLISQPVRSLLRSWKYDAAAIGDFGALIAIPWTIKPLYGLLTDFLPLLGSRRRSYLVLSTLLGAVSLLALYMEHLTPAMHSKLLLLLLLPTVAVAFGDVVVDALMVEHGQPLRLTGQLQSVQWGAIWTGSILAGWLGGYLSEHKLQPLGFLICGCLLLVTFACAVLFVRERKTVRPSFRATTAALRSAAGNRTLWAAALFILVWAFNPCSSAVLYVHLTRDLGLGEQFYGEMMSIQAAAAMVASFAYGLYCGRVRMRWLLYASVVLGTLSVGTYAAMYDETSGRLASVAFGFSYATATMIQLDLCARVAPVAAAGTVFALLMSMNNIAIALANFAGGRWHRALELSGGAQYSFEVLVAISAAFTASSCLLVPLLVPREALESPVEPTSDEA